VARLPGSASTTRTSIDSPQELDTSRRHAGLGQPRHVGHSADRAGHSRCATSCAMTPRCPSWPVKRCSRTHSHARSAVRRPAGPGVSRGRHSHGRSPFGELRQLLSTREVPALEVAPRPPPMHRCARRATVRSLLTVTAENCRSAGPRAASASQRARKAAARHHDDLKDVLAHEGISHQLLLRNFS